LNLFDNQKFLLIWLSYGQRSRTLRPEGAMLIQPTAAPWGMGGWGDEEWDGGMNVVEKIARQGIHINRKYR
jgi:hypothetical protein